MSRKSSAKAERERAGKKAAAPAIEAEIKPSRLKEAAGVVLVFASLYLLLAFFDYSPLDGQAGQAIRNGAGIIGHIPVHALVRFAGLGALIILALPGVVGVLLFRQRRLRAQLKHTLGAALMTFAVAGMAEIFLSMVHLDGAAVDAGGVLGAKVGGLALHYANRPGAFILGVTVLVPGFLLATGIPARTVLEVFKRLGGYLGSLGRALAVWFTKRMEQKRRHKEFLARQELEPTPPAAASSRSRGGAKNSAPAVPPPLVVRPPVPVIRKDVQIRPREATRGQPELDMQRKRGRYELPPTKLMNPPVVNNEEVDRKGLEFTSRQLEKKLADFNVHGSVVAVQPGPVVTMYELEPAPGTKVQKFVNLTDDLAMALRAVSIRVVAPIPGKNCVGIEIPNNKRETVFLREIIESSVFQDPKLKIPLALGKDISGEPIVADLAQMPHLLVAGSTGSGKSVSVNAMIVSVLYRFTPEQVKFIMIDPKMIELSGYDGIPHLRTPVLTNPKKAAIALRRCVDEMERRYALMKALGRAKDLETFNRRVSEEIKAKGKVQVAIKTGDGPTAEEETVDLQPLPYWIIIIDELADLMLVAKKDIEDSIARLTAKARAAGLHLIVATQRPSVDVITGVIKSNLPTRLSFQVASAVDSKTILDGSGAENLLGQGDSLFIPPKTGRLVRVHGAYVGEDEIAEIVEFLKAQGEPEYDESLLKAKPGEGEEGGEGENGDTGERDPLYDQVVHFVLTNKRASTSAIQRKFSIGYNRAARILDQMEGDGLVGPPNGSNPREILRESL